MASKWLEVVLMNLRKLSPLFVLVALLAVIALIQKRRPSPATIVDEAGLIALPTTAIRAAEIKGIDLHYGANRQAGVRLRRQDQAWVAVDYFSAPVSQAKIASLLRALARLQGELRSDKAELLKHFKLESGQAYHLRMFTRSMDRPAVHLLIGKRKTKAGFVRQQDDSRVYSTSPELFSALGIQPEQEDQPPDIKSWLDLQILNIAEHAIKSFSLRTPQRTWEFTRSLSTTPSRTDVASPATEQPQWILTNPVVELPLKQGQVEGLIATLRTLRAEDITDSDQLERYGLLKPSYLATVTWHSEGDGLQKSLIALGHEHPQHKGSRYARRRLSGPVYILPSWSFKHLFPKPKRFLALPDLEIQPDALRYIALSSPGRSVRFEWNDLSPAQNNTTPTRIKWRLSYPSVDFELRQEVFDKWVQHLSSISLAELAPESYKPDPEQIGPSLEVLLENGTRNTFRSGGEIDTYSQRHAIFFNRISTPFAITQTALQHIFPSLKDLVIMRPLNADLDNLTQLSWDMGDGMWRIARANKASNPDRWVLDSVWRFLHPETGDIDQQQLNTVLRYVVNISAEDWFETPEPEWNEAEQLLTVSLDFSDNRVVTLRLVKRGGSIGINYSNVPGLFIVSEEQYTTLHEFLVALASARIPAHSHFP